MHIELQTEELKIMSENIKASVIPNNAITEIAGKVYDDVAHKPLTQIGDVSEALMKLVFLPFKCLGMTIDELEKKYKLFIEKTINKVPQDKLVQPDTEIARQILEYVKFVFNEDMLVEMFSNLLSSDMNIDSKSEIHPSFVTILIQMNALDAKLLLYFHRSNVLFETILHFFEADDSYGIDNVVHEKNFYNISMVVHDIKLFHLSLSFLSNCGIIECYEKRKTNYKNFRKKIKKKYRYRKVPKTIKKVFKIKNVSKKSIRQTTLPPDDNLPEVLKLLKIKKLDMEMFYEELNLYSFTRYGGLFRMYCISEELEKYFPEIKLN